MAAAPKEVSLTQVWRDHQSRVQQLRDDAETKRRIAFSSAHTVTGLLAENVNGGVAAVFSNQRQIEAEAKLLQSQVAKFSKQTTQWVQMIEGFNTALKELGDIDNWVKTIERDMATIATSLEYATKAPPTAAAVALAQSAPAPSPAPTSGPASPVLMHSSSLMLNSAESVTFSCIHPYVPSVRGAALGGGGRVCFAPYFHNRVQY